MESAGAVQLLGRNGRAIRIRRVQGGPFSPNGKIYLVSDTKAGGILGFDLQRRHQIAHTEIDYSPFDAFGFQNHELEGITLWDTESLKFDYPCFRGQIHVPMVDTMGDDKTAGDSAFFAPDQKTFSFKVTAKAGSKLFYFCAVHPWMQGKITVK